MIKSIINWKELLMWNNFNIKNADIYILYIYMSAFFILHIYIYIYIYIFLLIYNYYWINLYQKYKKYKKYIIIYIKRLHDTKFRRPKSICSTILLANFANISRYFVIFGDHIVASPIQLAIKYHFVFIHIIAN